MSNEQASHSKNTLKNQEEKNGTLDAKFQPYLMVNSTLTISWMVILIFGIVVTLISYYSGCTGVDLIIRAGGAILIASLIFWFISSAIIKGAKELAKKNQEEEHQAREAQSNQQLRDIQA